MKKIIFLTLCALMVSALQAHAGSNPAANYLVQIGESSYAKGNMEDAAHEFSKALILDPANFKAVQHLKEMGYPQELYARPATSAGRIGELTREVERYRQMLAHIEDQRAGINAQLQQLGREHEGVVQDNQIKQEELKDVQKQVERMGLEIARLQKEHDRAMKKPAPFDADQRMRVFPESEHRGRIFRTSGSMTSAQLNKNISDTIDMSLNQEKELLALSRENRDLKKEITLEKSGQQNMMEVMDDYLILQQTAMADLGNQAVTSRLDQFDKIRQLKEKTEALAGSQSTLDDVISKAEERDAIIRQKNFQIEDLQKRLQWYQKNFGKPSDAQL